MLDQMITWDKYGLPNFKWCILYVLFYSKNQEGGRHHWTERSSASVVSDKFMSFRESFKLRVPGGPHRYPIPNPSRFALGPPLPYARQWKILTQI